MALSRASRSSHSHMHGRTPSPAPYRSPFVCCICTVLDSRKRTYCQRASLLVKNRRVGSDSPLLSLSWAPSLVGGLDSILMQFLFTVHPDLDLSVERFAILVYLCPPK